MEKTADDLPSGGSSIFYTQLYTQLYAIHDTVLFPLAFYTQGTSLHGPSMSAFAATESNGDQ